MCHISTAEDKAPCLTQTLGPGCLHCKPGKVYMLEKTPFPLAFCCILKQHQVPCFWAWRHEVIPPWRGGRMIGGKWREAAWPGSLGAEGQAGSPMDSLCDPEQGTFPFWADYPLLCEEVGLDDLQGHFQLWPSVNYELFMNYHMTFCQWLLIFPLLPPVHVLYLSPRAAHFRFTLQLDP